MSITVPNQLRSVDPWSENRFSDNYNIRSRILTGGKDVVLIPDSFKLTKTSDYTINIKPGIAIKDDVMIHIMEEFDIDIRENEGLMVDGQIEPPRRESVHTPYLIHIFLKYTYARSQPPNEASYELIRSNIANESFLRRYTPIKHMWLGYIGIVNRVIDTVSEFDSIFVEGDDVDVHIKRLYYYGLFGGNLTINCGTIREDAQWYTDWVD
jgi:hypothetical protein